MDAVSLAPALSPHGRLSLVEANDAPVLDPDLVQRLRVAFARGSGHGLLQLGAAEIGSALPVIFSYWREFGARFVTALCMQYKAEAPLADALLPPPPDSDLDWLALGAPPMTGAEYLTAAVLRGLWKETDAAFRLELTESGCGVQEFL